MPYLLLTGTTAFFCLFNQNKNNVLRKKVCCGVIWIGMILLVGLQGLNANADSLAYNYTYTKEPYWYSFFGYLYKQKKEPVFFMTSYIMARIGIPWQTYLMVYAGFVFGVVLYWLYLYSELFFLSVLIFEIVFFDIWVIAMRCGLAVAFMLLAYISAMNNKKKKTVVYIVLGFLSHQSIILFLPFFYVRKKKISDRMLMMYLLISVIAITTHSYILGFMNFVAEMIGRNTYDLIDTQTTYTFTILLIAIIFAAWLFKNNKICRNQIYADSFHAVLCSFIILSVVGGGVKLRLVFYYAMFICLIIPIIIKNIKPRLTPKICTMVTLMALYIQRMDFSRYYYFWQESVLK